jgi:DnaJ-class molecular chaperone
MKDPYQILGVTKDASQEAIKNAYRSLAKKYHPDLNPGNKERETKFKDIAAAYEKIGDPEMRAKFDRGETEDQMRDSAQRGYGSGPFYYESQDGAGRYSQSYGGGGFDEDFFENIFRQAGAGGARHARGRVTDLPGEDELYQMEVDLRDAALGAEREINLPSGKKLRVKIPAGIETGARLRFRGQGGPGIGKGPAGDVYVEVNVRPLEGFHRKGKEIEVEVPVSFIEAALGAEIQVPTIEGHVMLKIPPGVTTGSRLRVRGKGVASAKGERGDQIVSLKVVMPKTLAPEMKKAFEEWREKYSYNPRTGV